MRIYELRAPKDSKYTGNLSARHKWGGLPGLRCPECKATWAGSMTAYPSVDLSSLPERSEYEKPRAESFDEFVRLRELVRPLVPLVHRQALEQLQAEGVRSPRGFLTELRFRQRNHPELLELELLPHGRLHPACTPERPPPCPKCGRDAFRFPEAPILDATSFIATERFVEAVRRLGLDELDIREVPVR